ncbi:MAG: creatininase family protein [Candidatus Omnitrophota bacterium]|nr:MAG: creatininase family protein [Candidatus Omnitrophota bacterium]
MEKVNLMEMTLKEVKDMGNFEVAVLPWGSCEPHNFHLPYGTDTFAVEKIAKMSAEKAKKQGANVVVLPAIPVGVNSNLFGFPMTLNLSPTTHLAILKDIIESLETHKIYKLVLLNGHGGNEYKGILREIYGKTKVHVFLINWWTLIEELINKVCEDKTGEHANEAETSWMMYLYPELVHLEWADEGKVRKPVLKGLEKGWAWMARPWHLLTVSSGYGNPKKANAEKGKILVEDAVDKIASFLVELSKAKIDQYFPYKKEID